MTGPAESRAEGGRVRWRLQRRTQVDHLQLFRVGTVLAGLVVLTVVWSLNVQQTPGQFYAALWNGTFGSDIGLESIARSALPLVFLGLAIALPFRMGLWNLGAEGQLLMGAWGATGVAFMLPTLSAPILIPLMAIAAAVAGLLWMTVPALARAYLGISEIITTLLLNFVAMFWLAYWATGPWGETSTAGGVKSRQIPEQTQLGDLSVFGLNLPVGLAVGLVVALVAGLLMRHTLLGFEARIVGANAAAARFAGISVKRKIVVMMLLGGAIAGLAGAVQLMDVTYRYSSSLSENAGYTAIVVAVLAAGSPGGVVLLAGLLGVIAAGIDSLLVFGVPSDALFAVFGLILLLGATGDALARFQLVALRTDPAEPISEDPTDPMSNATPHTASNVS
jgi:simple sugar transport system permease protein